VTHTVYLVWLYLKFDEQVLALLSRDVLFENSEATRTPNAEIPFTFSGTGILSSAKSGTPNFFFAYVEFAQILIKIMHVYIIHIYVYMNVNRPRIHYTVITLWVSICSCGWYELCAEVLRHIF
jgi:hypothetical protein